MLQISAIGNIGNDAVIRETGKRKVISFSIGINSAYKDNNQQTVEKTVWLSCSLWKDKDQSTEIAKYLKKGDKVYISGVPEVQKYGDGEHIQVALCCIVSKIELLTSKEKQENENAKR